MGTSERIDDYLELFGHGALFRPVRHNVMLTQT
jgi:hypothetical protein